MIVSKSTLLFSISGYFHPDDSGMAVCTGVRGSGCLYYARVLEEEIWRTKNQNLPFSVGSDFVCLHQDFCELNYFCNIKYCVLTEYTLLHLFWVYFDDEKLC